MVILTKPAMAWDSFTVTWVPTDHENSLSSIYTIVPLLTGGDSEEEEEQLLLLSDFGFCPSLLLSDFGFCPCHDFWLQIQNNDYKINKFVNTISKIKNDNETLINMWFQRNWVPVVVYLIVNYQSCLAKRWVIIMCIKLYDIMLNSTHWDSTFIKVSSLPLNV